MNKEILLIGSGPSARLFFARHREIRPEVETFGLGFQLRFYEQLGFFPNYWALTDRKVVGSQWTEIRELLEESPSSMCAYLPIEAKRDLNRKVDWVKHSSTGTFALKKIQELGYDTVYLIGIEGKYQEVIPEAHYLSEEKREELNKICGLEPHEEVFQLHSPPHFNSNYFSDNYQRVGDVYSKPLTWSHKNGLQVEVGRMMQKGIRVCNLSEISSIKTQENAGLRVLFKTAVDSAMSNEKILKPSDMKTQKKHNESGASLRFDFKEPHNLDRFDLYLKKRFPRFRKILFQIPFLRKLINNLKRILNRRFK